MTFNMNAQILNTVRLKDATNMQRLLLLLLTFNLPCNAYIASRYKYGANVASKTPFEYYLRNICFPFLNHIISGIMKC